MPGGLCIQTMKQLNLPFNWFDIFLLVWLTMGIFRGRKRGMSEEVLTFLQWVVTLFACAFGYQILAGIMTSQFTSLGKLTAYIVSYLLIASVVAGIFLGFKSFLHGKLIGSDTFGKAEYYLGMPAGMIRFLCVLLCGLALLNARLYTPEEVKAMHDEQIKNYDSEFFPGLHTLQASVFQQSFLGPLIKKYLQPILIVPTQRQGAQKFKQKDWNPTP